MLAAEVAEMLMCVSFCLPDWPQAGFPQEAQRNHSTQGQLIYFEAFHVTFWGLVC